MKPIRALLLAAGLGTRLRPITNSTPKCMVPLDGEPILEHWLKKLELAGCETALVNTHHLSEQVVDFIKKRPKSSMVIKIVHEPNLLGTAGTLLTNEIFFNDSVGLLIHADNAMSENLSPLINKHISRHKSRSLTMLTFTTSQPSRCGIVQVDSNDHLLAFYEKIVKPPGNKANGAVYVFDSDFMDSLKKIKPPPEDFSNDVIPKFIDKIQTYHTLEPYIDIGRPETLQQAQILWGEKKTRP